MFLRSNESFDELRANSFQCLDKCLSHGENATLPTNPIGETANNKHEQKQLFFLTFFG